jgi:hypothetical protein
MTGYNPYRKANGEFASKSELGSIDQKLEHDLASAVARDDSATVAEIEYYAAERAPESPLGQKVLETRYGLVSAVAALPLEQRIRRLASQEGKPSLSRLGVAVAEADRLRSNLETEHAQAVAEHQSFLGRLSPETQDAMEYLEELETEVPDYAALQREFEDAFKLPKEYLRKLGTLEKRAYDQERTAVRKNREMLLALAKLLQWDPKRPGPNADTEYRRVKKLIAEERALRRARIDTKKSLAWLKDAVKASEDHPQQ